MNDTYFPEKDGHYNPRLHGCGCDSCLGKAPPITVDRYKVYEEDDRVAWGASDHGETLRREREDEEWLQQYRRGQYD